GDLVQAGTLQGNGVTVTSTGTLTQQGRIVAGNGTSTLSAAAINQTESGSIQGGGGLSLRATGGIVNRGFVGTAADLLLQAGGVIENGGLLYGGGHLWLLSDALVNRFGNILAGNSLWIQRDAAGTASGSVLNSSGTIETQRGDITVRTGTLTNQREGLVVTESGSTAADMPSWAGGTTAQIPIGYFNNTKDYTIVKDVSINDNGGTNGCGCSKVTSYFYSIASTVINGTISVPVYQSNINVVASGGEARFLSGKDILIDSGSLNNKASLIGAYGNVLLSGGDLNNSSYQSGSSKRVLYYKFDTKDSRVFWGANNPGRLLQYFPFVLAQDNGVEYTPGQTYAATIQAGGAITASFSQNISNTNLQPGSGGFMPALATPTLAGVSALTPVGA
ncbi:hemolysin BL-binding protein, partial [Dickeya sp. ws52]